MEQIKQIIYIFAFYLFAQLPAIAVWQSQAIPEKIRLLLVILLTGLATTLVAENYRRKFSINLPELRLSIPSFAEMKQNTGLILGCALAGLAWFAIYFAVYRLLFPGAYAELMKESAGILSSLANWQKSDHFIGLVVLISGQFLLSAAEEYLFRGVIYNFLLRSMSWRKAILWSSVSFALFHMRLASLPIYVVCGVLYCWLYRRTGSLFAPVLAHFIYNFSLVMIGEHLVLGI